jgi:WD40 repeat protein
MPDAPPPSPQPHSFSIPSEIGGFLIQRVLGTGGMATVYAALQKQPRRTVALKVMKAGVTTETALRRFKREVEILGRLRHPYIAQVFAAGTHHDAGGAEIPYFVMEYVPGARNLLEFVSMNTLDLRERLKLFVKICAAVEHGHRAKVIHRDLKPGNILIDENGEPKIIDFGVAHTTELDLASGAAAGQETMTEAGRLVGTLHYMAPEQVDTTRQDLDPRCDVYALGVILYKLMTGRLPLDLDAVPIYEAARMIRQQMPRSPSQVNPAIKGDLETIILKALEKDRLRRYSNAGSLGRDIVRYLADKPIHGRRAGAVYRATLFVKRQRTAVIVGVVVVLALAGAGGYVWWRDAELDAQRRQFLAAGNQLENDSTQTKKPPGEGVAAADQSQADDGGDGSYTLHGHAARIARLTFSPDGASLATSDLDQVVIVWDLGNRAPLRTIHVPGGGATSFLAFSGDCKRLVSASSSGDDIVVTEISTGRALHRIRPECARILSLAVDASGERIAFSCDDLTLRIQDITTGSLSTLRGTTGAFTGCAFSSKGALLAAGSERGKVHVWELATGSRDPKLWHQFHDLTAGIAALAFSPFGDLTAVATDGNAMMWRLDAGEADASQGEILVASFVAAIGAREMVDVAFDPTGQRLACASSTTLTLWDLSTIPPKPLARPMTIGDQVSAAAIDPAGDLCAQGQGDGDIQIVPLLSANAARPSAIQGQ